MYSVSLQEILLRRAADSLEAFYSYPRGQGTAGPLNHIGPVPTLYATTSYPRSPAALFAPLLTPQGFATAAATKWNTGFTTGALISPTKIGGYSHVQNDSIRKIPGLEAAEGSASSTVSRSSSDEMIHVHAQGQENHHQQQHDTNSASFFTFPPMHETLAHTEIKHEFQNPSEIHKPKPITPGPHIYPVAMPFVQVAPMHNQGHAYTSYSMAAPYSSSDHNLFMSVHGDGSNRNNNNNVTLATYAGLGNHMMAMNPVFIPPSPGFIMAPTGTYS